MNYYYNFQLVRFCKQGLAILYFFPLTYSNCLFHTERKKKPQKNKNSTGFFYTSFSCALHAEQSQWLKAVPHTPSGHQKHDTRVENSKPKATVDYLAPEAVLWYGNISPIEMTNVQQEGIFWDAC